MTTELNQILPWAHLLSVVIVWSGFAWISYCLGISILLRPVFQLPDDIHWTEKARQIYPARQFFFWTSFMFLLVGAWVGQYVAVGWGRNMLVFILTMAASSLFVIAIGYRKLWRQGVGQRGQQGSLISGFLVMLFFFVNNYLIPFVGLIFLPTEWGVLLAFWVIAGLFLFWLYRTYLSIPILRLLGALRLADNEVTQLIREEAEMMRLKQPPVYLINTPMANAVAFTSNHSVAFTAGCCDALGAEELRAIGRHELAHLAESPAVRLLRSLVVLMWAPLMLIGASVASFGITGGLVCLVGMFVVIKLHRILILKLEHSADRKAVGGKAADPEYASALEKIYRWNRMPVVLRKRKTHPHLYDRMLEAGVTPDFPRPAPPSLKGLWTPLIVAVIVLFVAVIAAHFLGLFFASQWVDLPAG